MPSALAGGPPAHENHLTWEWKTIQINRFREAIRSPMMGSKRPMAEAEPGRARALPPGARRRCQRTGHARLMKS
ncbi:hypothetical protein CNECB9_2330007 [Cupriavidus necator]|uniref:Uncharacterized protein n=1 Tax=Cupriavidus necator TaxID=106590 RepID=A0A1K0JJC6_CUPNE|nr:hypothetical protein CNECB9_2330007 [Cupriavidus necator]